MILHDSIYFRVEQTSGFTPKRMRPYYLRIEVSREVFQLDDHADIQSLITAQEEMFTHIDRIHIWIHDNVDKSKHSYSSNYKLRQGWFMFRFKERNDLIRLKLALS